MMGVICRAGFFEANDLVRLASSAGLVRRNSREVLHECTRILLGSVE